MNKTYISRVLLIAALSFTAFTARAMENFVETFDTGASGWSGRLLPSLTWFSDGGPAGANDAYISVTNCVVADKPANSFIVVLQGAKTNASGGAFVGNWITSGVRSIAMDVRHNFDDPVSFGLRFSFNNHPAVAVGLSEKVRPNEWTRLVAPISDGALGVRDYNFEGSTYSNVYANINTVQLFMYGPEGYSERTNDVFKIDVDNVAIVVSNIFPSVTRNPTYDRWFYTFAMTGASAPIAPTYATDDLRFDERDSQAYFAFVLTNEIPAGLGVENYEILSCRFVATMQSSTEAIAYDSTPDAWTSYLAPTSQSYTADADAGRPVDLYGAGWRYDYTPWTFKDNGPYSTPPPDFQNPEVKGKRTAYPLGLRNGELVDVSNNLDLQHDGADGFDPIPFAVGKAALNEGDQIPEDTAFTFDVNVADTNVQAYLAQALDDGILALILSSLHYATEARDGGYPYWYQNERVDGMPATLEITYKVKGPVSLGADSFAGVRVARWPKTAASAMLEATTNLVAGISGGAPKWMPVAYQLEETDQEFEATLPVATNLTTLFLRLVEP